MLKKLRSWLVDPLAKWVKGVAEWVDRTDGRLIRFDVLFGLAVIVAVAVFGLFVENGVNDLLGHHISGSTHWTWGGLVLALGLLCGWMYWVRRVVVPISADRGTVYYVRYLPSFVSDWYLAKITEEDRTSPGRPLDRKIIATTPAYQRGEVHHDAVAELDALYARLENVMNLDDQATAFRVTPNLLWPAGFRLGCELTARPALQLEEVERAELVEDGTHGAVVSEMQLDPWKWRLQDPALVGRGHAPIESREVESTAGAQFRSVLIMADLSRQDLCTRPTTHSFDRVIRVGHWGGVDGQGTPVTVPVRHVPIPAADAAGAIPVVSPAEATIELANTIRRELHTHPEATIYLIARIPKSVAVALGQQLMSMAATDRVGGHPGCGHPRCYQESCTNPWSRLVALSWVGGPRITRVHPSQPPLPELVAAWDALATGAGR